MTLYLRKSWVPLGELVKDCPSKGCRFGAFPSDVRSMCGSPMWEARCVMCSDCMVRALSALYADDIQVMQHVRSSFFDRLLTPACDYGKPIAIPIYSPESRYRDNYDRIFDRPNNFGKLERQ